VGDELSRHTSTIVMISLLRKLIKVPTRDSFDANWTSRISGWEMSSHAAVSPRSLNPSNMIVALAEG
jgi:hypothetical protein